ncbi:MAG: putative 2OG-Fe(II) oxygenase [Phenylobacterium sp.]
MSEAMVERAGALVAQGRMDEALALTADLMKAAQPSHVALAAHAAALKASGRLEEALPFNREATERFATSPVAWHNYAATLGDLGRGPEAVAACEQAFRLGLDVPETWSVYARAKQATGDHAGAEHAYRQSLMRAGRDPRVAGELADLVWMMRGDVAQAEAVLDVAFHAGAPPVPLLLAKASLFEAAGEDARAAALLAAAIQQLPGETALMLAAAQAALRQDRRQDADAYVRQAEAVDPRARSVVQHRAIVDLALGRPDEALTRLKAALEEHPSDQSLWGWAVTAARAAGDPLYGRMADYEAVVAAYDIAPPEGWPDLGSFLSDLRNSLNKLHSYRTHPSQQSLRNGSQTMHLLSGSDDPAIRGFFRAVDAPIRAYMATLGKGDEPLRRRNTFDYRIAGAWSVRLKPHGYHRDHFHSEGWLSSAFYVETPETALDSADREGWIRFGQPPFPTEPPLPADHYIRPRPGRLVLFPSYMWHGTVPFTTDESRLTIAFDAVPKR